MKIGIILPCFNIEKHINLATIFSLIELYSDLHFCFVNNASSDDSLSILEYIKRETNEEVSVLDIKRNKSQTAVLKAGVRYLNTKVNLKWIQSIQMDFNMSLKELRVIFDRTILRSEDLSEDTIYQISQSRNKRFNQVL
ncbi:glycosyltransferase [Flavicella sediminum]|uniref:glycosyltransferase n=1 Tax=Flavicella sediminum TaxID=2585141 RepID=UPI001123D645|nr:glycosyltransferase [Flavicella sediminum]